MNKNVIYIGIGAALLYFFTKNKSVVAAGKAITLTKEEQEKLNVYTTKNLGDNPLGVKARRKAIEDAGGTIDEIKLIRS
jgi:hypothetical protein